MNFRKTFTARKGPPAGCDALSIFPVKYEDSLASQPLRLRRKGLVNCQQATCNSLQESCSPIRLQENLLIIFMEHKMASKRVEMLFAKKTVCLKL